MIKLNLNMSKKEFKLFSSFVFIILFILISLFHSFFIFLIQESNTLNKNLIYHFFVDLFFKNLFIAGFSGFMVSFFPFLYFFVFNFRKIKEKIIEFFVVFSFILFFFSSLIFLISVLGYYFNID